MIENILKLFGFVGSTTNAVTGALNYAGLAAGGLWAWGHREEPIKILLGSVSFDTNMATLAVLGLIGFFYIELQRRTHPTSQP